MNTNSSTFMLLYESLAKVERNGTFPRSRFGDGRLDGAVLGIIGYKTVIRHDAFDEIAFYVFFQ